MGVSLKIPSGHGPAKTWVGDEADRSIIELKRAMIH